MRLSKLLALFILAILSFPSIGAAQSTLNTRNSQSAILVPYAEEAITIAGTAIGFTAATINPTCTDCPVNVLRAQRADCVTEATSGAQIRVTGAGTTPTAAVGQLLSSGQVFTVYGYTAIAAFRAIRTASTSVPMYCVYSRWP